MRSLDLRRRHSIRSVGMSLGKSRIKGSTESIASIVAPSEHLKSPGILQGLKALNLFTRHSPSTFPIIAIPNRPSSFVAKRHVHAQPALDLSRDSFLPQRTSLPCVKSKQRHLLSRSKAPPWNALHARLRLACQPAPNSVMRPESKTRSRSSCEKPAHYSCCFLPQPEPSRLYLRLRKRAPVGAQ